MERLLKDAQAITGVEYNIDNLADVYTAIGVIQEKLGIAGTTAKEAATTISGSAATMKAAWQNVLTAMSGGGDMDSAINNIVDSVDIYVDNILPVVEKALIGIGVLTEKIAPKLAETVGKAFIAQIPNLITAIYAMIVGAFKGIFSGTVALFKKETKDLLGEQTEKIEESAKKQEEFTDAVKDTNKELKKTLAGFDEIQILSTSAQEENEIVPMQMSKDSKLSDSSVGGSEYVRQVDETLNAIMGIVALCLAAVGLILIFTGANIAFGIGFVVAGAATLGVSMSSLSKTDVGNDVIQMLLTITAVASGALLAIGIMLCFLMGASPVSVGLIVAGGALLVGSVGALIGLNPDDIASWLSIIMGIAGGAMLALGIILCMVGSIPVGVGLIIAGAVSLVSAVALNFDAVVDAIQGPLAAIMSIVGAALLVVGIILVCTGVGIPVGIALIAAGAAALVTPIALNWNAIVDWVKGAWDAVKNFWNAYIAPVFTAEFWLNLGKTCINGLIAGFEGGINGIILAFESMINWIVDGLNKISFDIPDWLGGGHFGINLPRASFGRVSIPRLAQGAVIPPNKEFLAVLGDQKQGTNIEAPLQTIVDAFNIALAQNGGAGGGNTEVVLEIDGREFGRAVVEQGNRENRRIGTRLVIG